MSNVAMTLQNASEVLPLLEYAKYKGIIIKIIKTIEETLSYLSTQSTDAVIIDHQIIGNKNLMYDTLGKELSKFTKRIFVIGNADDASAKQHATILGADFFAKPLTLESFHNMTIELAPSKPVNNQFISGEISPVYQGLGKIIGQSAAIKNIFQIIKRVAPTQASTFIIGKSGTGKELVAQAIHEYSTRHNKPYLAINCGAISSELISSALFGHEKGSFTGAMQSHKGYFEQASGGTLFLDEITETSLDLQVRLLRVLETGKVIPVGGKRQLEVDVRIIASTNRCPQTAVAQQILREDLFYRLNVFPIVLPTLNEREGDALLLAEYFLEYYNTLENKEKKFSQSALQLINKMHFPGNVRELKNLVYRAFILADDLINIEHIQQFPPS